MPALRGRTEKNHEQLNRRAGAGAKIVTVHTRMLSKNAAHYNVTDRRGEEVRRENSIIFSLCLPEQEGSFDEAMV